MNYYRCIINNNMTYFVVIQGDKIDLCNNKTEERRMKKKKKNLE